MRTVTVVALGALAFGCSRGVTEKLSLPHQTNSFQVQVTAVTTPDGQPLAPGDGASEATAWPFPLGNVKFHLSAQALDERGQPFPLNRAVAIRVTPGDIDPKTRTMMAVDGKVEGDVQAAHVFGRANVWVLDAPADEVYGDGGVPVAASPPSALADGGHYSNAAGASPSLYFKRPTLAEVQRQPLCDPSKSFSAPVSRCDTDADCLDAKHHAPYSCYQHTCLSACDNRLSPLVGDFITVEEPYTADDAGMIITAVTQDGFYVQDLSAQKYSAAADPSLAAWQALPGTFGQLFVYTYSAPTNLYVGDHLLSLSGSIQEFSGDTQLDFPSWVKVNQQPTPAFLPAPTPITLTICGSDPQHSNSVQDLCGYYNGGTAAMSLESLESAPVTVDGARPTNHFEDCDFNGNGVLPLFANSSSQGGWYCFPGDPNGAECDCEIACITGEPRDLADGGTLDFNQGADGGPAICSEKATFTRFGQWEVVLADEHRADGGLAIPSAGTRINVTTRDALPNFNPLDLEKPEYQGITFRVTGMLNQVQASRPRWLIYARDTSDVCCHEAHLPDGTTHHCPPGVSSCEAVAGQ